MVKKILSHLAWILWLVVIFIAMGFPGDKIAIKLSFLEWISADKIFHLLVFGVLSFLMINAFFITLPNVRAKKVKWAIVLFTLFIGAFTEYLQNTVFIGRDGNVYDFIADAIGVFLGLYFFNVADRIINYAKRILCVIKRG